MPRTPSSATRTSTKLATFLDASRGGESGRRAPSARASARSPLAAMRVFLGVTGASGAPYAKGSSPALAAAGGEVGLAASAAGIEVIATELYGDATLAA